MRGIMEQEPAKRILLGVTGGIAAYKAAELLRLLMKQGIEVQVAMTEAACHFITPTTMQGLSGKPVLIDQWDMGAANGMAHISPSRAADAIVIAPATADFIAKLAHGLANDLLSSLRLAQDIAAFFQPKLFSGKKILITAGPTYEAIDAVRGITNRSSGKMGYAIVQAALEQGAEVVLVSGPTALAKPHGSQGVDVVSAAQMFEAVQRHVGDCDIFIGVAAVADYRDRKSVV